MTQKTLLGVLFVATFSLNSFGHALVLRRSFSQYNEKTHTRETLNLKIEVGRGSGVEVERSIGKAKPKRHVLDYSFNERGSIIEAANRLLEAQKNGSEKISRGDSHAEDIDLHDCVEIQGASILLQRENLRLSLLNTAADTVVLTSFINEVGTAVSWP